MDKQTIPTDVLIAMTEARTRIKDVEGLKAKLRAAMKATRDHWICVDEDACFRAAVGAVMIDYGEGSPEFEQLHAELKLLQQFSLMMQAGKVGLSVQPPETPDDSKIIGLMGLWKEQ